MINTTINHLLDFITSRYTPCFSNGDAGTTTKGVRCGIAVLQSLHRVAAVAGMEMIVRYGSFYSVFRSLMAESMAQIPALRFVRSLSNKSLSGVPFGKRRASFLRPSTMLMFSWQRFLKRTEQA